jgi:hypothetical protein
MKRLHDWQTQFESFIHERQEMQFVWGTNDCAIFAADCVQALTGIDPALQGLREHTTEKQALRALERHGGLVGIATAAMGEPVTAMFANIGDVVLSKSEGRDMLSICNGTTVLAPSATGLVAIPLDTAATCWKVG